jgi:hypothetical protein
MLEQLRTGGHGFATTPAVTGREKSIHILRIKGIDEA